MSERKTSVSLLGNRKSKSKFIPTELKWLFICRAEGQLDEVWTIMWTCQTEDRPPLCLRAAWSLNTQIRRSFVLWLIFSKVQAKELEIRAFSCLPAPFFLCVCMWPQCAVCVGATEFNPNWRGTVERVALAQRDTLTPKACAKIEFVPGMPAALPWRRSWPGRSTGWGN